MIVNVLEFFEQGALLHFPLKTALIEGERKFTFGQLERLAKRCAHLILERVAAINSPIAVFLPKCAETVIANLGILYTGNCYANLDVKSPAERLRATLNNLSPRIIITTRAHSEVLRSLGLVESHILLIDEVFTKEDVYDDSAFLECRRKVIDMDPVCIIHTSGSTGIPKGVALTHRGTIDFMEWVFSSFSFDSNEVIGSLSPFYFDIYTLELFVCLFKGATLVIIPDNCAAFPIKLLEFVASQAVTFIFWVPTIMVNIANQNLLAQFPLKSLILIFFAGEVFPTKHLNYWRRNLPHALFVNLYGPIEIHVDCTYFIVEREFSDEDKLPIGLPCRNTDILILNENNQSVVDGENGELCVRGTSLALGYWNNPERTNIAFVQNPLNPHYPERIYRTGDLVYRNERGEIMFAGRKDYQIKHLGYRIELGEIEHAVLQVDGVRNCCVCYNQAKKEIVLFFESDEDRTPADFRAKLKDLLPKYMLPTIFRRIDSLPRNPNGKIDRNRLALSVD